MRIIRHDTTYKCHCDGRIMAETGEREPNELEHPGLGLHGFFCETCGIQYSKIVWEERWAEVVRKQREDWMDPTCRKVLVEELGQDKVADIDKLYHRSVDGQKTMIEAVDTFFEWKRSGSKKSLVDFLKDKSVGTTNEMMLEKVVEASSLSMLKDGPVQLGED